MRHHPELWLAGGGALLIALFWLAGGSRPGSGIGLSTSMTAFGAGFMALVALVVAVSALAVSSRAEELPAGLLDDAPGPAAVTLRSGRILALNGAMRSLAGERGGRIEALLAELVEADAGMIYRMVRAAGRVGFALEEVRPRTGPGLACLVVRDLGGARLVWMLATPEHLAAAMPSAITGKYEGAPFGHATIRDGRVIATNLRFRASFGDDAERTLAPLMGPDGPRAGRFALKHADGGFAVTRAFVAEHPGSGGTEIFLFDVRDAQPTAHGPGFALDRVPIALVQVATDGRIVWLNEAAGRMLGPDAKAGEDLAALIELRGRPLASLLEEALTEGEQSQAETVRATGGAPDTFAQIRMVRAEFGGEETLLAVLTDASELRLLEDKFAQSHKMEAVGKLAGGVAHDFNNLLTAINGHCDLLLIGRDASQPDYADLNQIRQNANRAAALVRQLLAFSRKQTLNPALISLEDVVSDTLYLLVRLIGDRVKIEIEHAREPRPGLVRADRQQIEQALMNLVVNARDAMPGGGKVTISTRSRRIEAGELRDGAYVPRGDYVELSVADEGTGIDSAIMGKIFDPFFTTKPLGEGTGLGLSTVYGIVKQSGGYVFAENRPEGGAQFRILLPRADAQPAAEAPAEDAAPKPDLTGEASVLLVEDEASVRSVATRALTLRGYRVTAADSAAEALELVRDPDRRIDLVISDVMMPGMDGPSFAAAAREIRPRLRVLFISGYAEEAFRRNMTDPDYAFLAKPFSIAELTAKVKEVLGGPEGG